MISSLAALINPVGFPCFDFFSLLHHLAVTWVLKVEGGDGRGSWGRRGGSTSNVGQIMSCGMRHTYSVGMIFPLLSFLSRRRCFGFFSFPPSSLLLFLHLLQKSAGSFSAFY